MQNRSPNVEYDINKRWESGTKHHPKSIELMKRMSDLDWELMDGALDLKSGGDGDNGETMMYLMDIYFEEQDDAANKGPVPGKCIC